MILSPALPARAGVGFKPMHFAAILEDAQRPAFFEIHAENYMGDGGPAHRMIERLHAQVALAVHGVGLSIGGAERLDGDHLARLRRLCERHKPECFSEHLAWSSHGGVCFNDLLPLPYTRRTLQRVCDHVDETQDALGRRMLLENPATYVTFRDSEFTEADFLAQIAQRTGCGLLFDVNNLYVSAVNHGVDPDATLEAFPLHAVGQIHLAGHAQTHDAKGAPLLIDAHDRAVSAQVWDLYARAIARIGPKPTLIEWDNDPPDWPVLAAQAHRADAILARSAGDV